MNIRKILESKGGDVVTIDETATIADAAVMLTTHRIGALLSLNERGDVAGVLSERDIVRLIADGGGEALSRTVASVMTRNVTTADLETTIDEAMEIMTHGRFRHLPVREGGRLVGIVSIGDVVKRRIETVEREAEDLKAYIHAG
jgi:CBS domain-containing protein